MSKSDLSWPLKIVPSVFLSSNLCMYWTRLLHRNVTRIIAGNQRHIHMTLRRSDYRRLYSLPIWICTFTFPIRGLRHYFAFPIYIFRHHLPFLSVSLPISLASSTVAFLESLSFRMNIYQTIISKCISLTIFFSLASDGLQQQNSR